MREIKFRAWDVLDEFMSVNNETPLVENILNAICGQDEPLTDEEKKRFKLMQYTGLKDKINRNEVYEHDIINHVQNGFLKVEWDYRDTGWICIDKKYKKYNLSEILLSGGIKVGNIYENPELLHVKE